METLSNKNVNRVLVGRIHYGNVSEFINAFAAHKATEIRVLWEGDYKNADSCKAILVKAVKRLRKPMKVRLLKSGTEVWLRKII